MGRYTRYLIVRGGSQGIVEVSVTSGSALSAISDAAAAAVDLRYSPILPAYLVPGELPASPATPFSCAFFFSPKPYHMLGTVKPTLTLEERSKVFFSEGVASVVALDLSFERACELQRDGDSSRLEYWPTPSGHLSMDSVKFSVISEPSPAPLHLTLTETGLAELDVYLEQIASSVVSLWGFYGKYFPEEHVTLTRILGLVNALRDQYQAIGPFPSNIDQLRRQNSIVAALVELSAALSYSVTQGTSGVSPILSNRSPFPHHSLLGVGNAVRALTKFTRYLESALSARSAARIITYQYETKVVAVPSKLSQYTSGSDYAFDLPPGKQEEFDSGGEFRAIDPVPLLLNFSLRHGFKEAKFSVSAASESLTAECLPPWTMMTLSHEVMHSRVRDIFQALFGTDLDGDSWELRWNDFHRSFVTWCDGQVTEKSLADGIRNAVLYFCCAVERGSSVVNSPSSVEANQISRDLLLSYFRRHKRLAIELFVHFHDYYFAYACQPKLYIVSLWVSWATVAAPVARPMEYLVRTLATVACGTGAEPGAAYEAASELLNDGLESLEAVGRTSPLFNELRALLALPNKAAYAQFKPAYYLIDQVRKNFASRLIAAQIDRVESDPFAAGSSVAADYSSSIYVHGSGESEAMISPVRYSLASLVHQLLGQPQLDDVQWLTAWNSMVIASQEVQSC